jgi:hypothetical protein
VIPFHGHPLYAEGTLEAAGLPTTVQNRLFTEITYDKSIYPEIFTPETGILLPAEISWKVDYGQGLSEQESLRAISEGLADRRYPGLRHFALAHPLVLIKGAAESGARNLKVFDMGVGERTLDEAQLAEAAQFIYQRARADNVSRQHMVIQEAIVSSPEAWATGRFLRSFVERQILEWSRPVNYLYHPRSAIYGSMRVVASASGPRAPYIASHLLTLTSLQVATNVGRGGTLELLDESFIHAPWRQVILEGLRAEVPKVMKALQRYAERRVAGAASQITEGGNTQRKDDLRGVPYTWPPYMMLDYLATPIYQRPGRLVEIIWPRRDDDPCRIVLEDQKGRFPAEIKGFRFVLLEPNIGIGLWDRVSLRESEHEQRRAAREGRLPQPQCTGVNDRLVLDAFADAAEEYLQALARAKKSER